MRNYVVGDKNQKEMTRVADSVAKLVGKHGRSNN